MEILQTSSKFFENGARPSGILTAPGAISQDTADRLKSEWNGSYSGLNSGKVAVLGDGLKFEGMAVDPVDAQLIEQLKYSAQMVCTAFHVPGFKVGIGDLPSYQNAQVLNQIYYTDCLQKIIEDLELALGEGLRLPENIGVEFSVEDLLRMDAQTQMNVLKEGVGAKIFTPNEARKRLKLSPTGGGDALWGQQQDHSLEALARRDEEFLPQGGVSPLPGPAEPSAEDDEVDEERAAILLEKMLQVD